MGTRGHGAIIAPQYSRCAITSLKRRRIYTLTNCVFYLYWQLRAGIFAVISFLWFIFRISNTFLIYYFFRNTEEDFFFGLWGIHMLLIFRVGCFFALVYGDMMSGLMAVVLTTFELQAR